MSSKPKPYNILEVANTHGGDLGYLQSLISEFDRFRENTGIKFQVFHADGIALPDFSAYELYKKLYFSPSEWRSVLLQASRTKDIWIDVFDAYSAEIIDANFELICGIKMQASTLENIELLKLLSQNDWSGKSIIVNVSGYEQTAIRPALNRIKEFFGSGGIILQFGFQKYPADLEDCGFGKIRQLRQVFDGPLSFADHLSPETEGSSLAPLVAMMMGIQYLEKHVRSADLPTEYDHYSSMSADQFEQYVERLEDYDAALRQPFVNDNEAKYLASTIQVPVLKDDKQAGQPIYFDGDLDYRRTDQDGLSYGDLKTLQERRTVLSRPVESGKTLCESDFRPARIGVVVVARLKSGRLKRKQVLRIGGLSATELCLRNVLKLQGIDKVVLATSTIAEDAELAEHLYSDDVGFYQGDPEDVMQRVLDVLSEHELDVFVRITGDTPYPSDEVLQLLLDAHFRSGVDYTRAKTATLGTNIEIIATPALRKAKELFPQADYSEYMTYYFTNNPGYFSLQEIDLPAHLIRDYRLTLDYEEDLGVFRRIEDHMAANSLANYTLVDVLEYLDEHPDVAAMNQSILQVYQQDDGLIKRVAAATTVAE